MVGGRAWMTLRTSTGGSVRGCSRVRRTPQMRYMSIEEPPRINPVGIQYLSKSLHEQVFGNQKVSSKEDKMSAEERQELINLSRRLLKSHGLLDKKTAVAPPISFPLPKLQGNSLDEHFQRLGHYASEPYKTMCLNKFTKILPRPKQWIRHPGWMKYGPGQKPTPVSFPGEDTLVFDVETLYNISHYPTIAVALSAKAWYLWCSPFICNSNDYKHLIPLNTTNKTQLVIGHNVAYDRARVLEEYNFKASKAFFLDTQSLHVASAGLCSRQRPKFMQQKKKRQEEEQEGEEENSGSTITSQNMDFLEDPWLNVSSMNSLRDVAWLHCGIRMDKSTRDIFTTLDKNKIINDFQRAVDYCATDVGTTSVVFDKIFPLFLEKCPHPVSFGALKPLSSCILPTERKKWQKYIQSAEGTYQSSKKQIEDKIIQIVEDIVKLKDDPNYEEKIHADPWWSQLDWTIKPLRMTKKGVPVKNQKMPGYPEWYRSLFANKASTKPQITIKSRIIPILFKLSWEGSPVIWTDSCGWCFGVSKDEVPKFKAKNYILADEETSEAWLKLSGERGTKKEHGALLKVPHPNGPQFNCTTLLSKPFIHFFDKDILTSKSDLAKEALKMNASGSYWMSARERITSQFVVHKSSFPEQFQSLPTANSSTSGSKKDVAIILPSVIPMGTVTRRAVESTWLTASNAKKDRIGSELKAQVEAPEGFCFVGADVDSEELWIASLVGDSVFNIHGGTAIGWMCLEGTKNAGTDLHTKTADILGCSRNEAKIFNYGRIYGAGAKFAGRLLKQFNPSLSEEQAKQIANKLYETTKGQTRRSKVFQKFWFGGSESILFNKLENIAEQDEPRTPVLGSSITSSLLKKNLRANSYLPSRINWAIQSSGVDYLHLLCCSMNYLIDKYNISARLCISIHDEIRYLVAEEDKYRAAMALQISNLWTRAMFCEQMGIDDLPQNCAFFSAVDIDKVLRKEVDMDCITPSNPNPIPPGESLGIRQLLELKESELNRKEADTGSDILKYPYKPRTPVFAKYNRAYTKEFLTYFLKLQVQTSKWDVEEIEKAYIRSLTEKQFQKDKMSVEYGLLDYLKDLREGKKIQKISIMDAPFLELESRLPINRKQGVQEDTKQIHEDRRPSSTEHYTDALGVDYTKLHKTATTTTHTAEKLPKDTQLKKRKRQRQKEALYERFYASMEAKKTQKYNSISVDEIVDALATDSDIKVSKHKTRKNTKQANEELKKDVKTTITKSFPDISTPGQDKHVKSLRQH